ncbi:MAG: hypothetical protein E7048_02030 [Lentisphaerae bacterium]|nr:hypothetical protein [Lentisphaerota bacterium]MBR2872270.1 hypothetical protein [Lentisphaeria bacterium]
MNISPEIEQATKELRLSYPNYTTASFQFVSKAVTYTIDKLSTHRHISALELLEGIREYAFLEYGVVAPQVLCSFGLCSARNVGEVVYLLISVGLLSASPDDSLEDFNVNFSWDEQLPAAPESEKLPCIDTDKKGNSL